VVQGLTGDTNRMVIPQMYTKYFVFSLLGILASRLFVAQAQLECVPKAQAGNYSYGGIGVTQGI
jgi:hypothetical protein